MGDIFLIYLSWKRIKNNQIYDMVQVGYDLIIIIRRNFYYGLFIFYKERR